jgi:CheY-like chemotaxis protein
MPASLKALVVDDDPVVAESLKQALGGRTEVDAAADAPSAIALLESSRYGCLVLDLALASGSAFDVLTFMSRRGIKLPTVVITAKLPESVRDLLIAEQVKLLLPVPVDPSLLASAVLGLCGIER